MSKVYEIKANAGEDIKSVIEAFVIEKGWKNAYISGAIGSVKNLRFTAPTSFELPPKVLAVDIEGPAEVLAFTGEITVKELMDPSLAAIYKDDGPLFIHIHASAATAGGHVYGGGFQKGLAFRSLKVYIQEI